jgi:hypothetical protein
VAQLVQRAKVFLAKSHPALFALGAPEIARQAAHQPLAMIIDLDQFLATLIAGQLLPHLRMVFQRYYSAVSPPRMMVSCSSV